jgi:tetratricopeptide (TPR) repeat protein
MSDHSVDDATMIAEQIYQCFEQGDFNGAIVHLDKAIRNYPDRAYFYTERANFRTQLGDYKGAIEDYNQAILLNPTTAIFYTWRGRMYRKMGEEAAASADFLKASTLLT